MDYSDGCTVNGYQTRLLLLSYMTRSEIYRCIVFIRRICSVFTAERVSSVVRDPCDNEDNKEKFSNSLNTVGF